MHELNSTYDVRLQQLIEEASSHNIDSEEFANAAKNLETFLKCRTLLPQPEPEPDPVPTTVWGRVKAATAAVWDNETTRVLIKAGGSLAGVGLVVYSTIQRDHVLEKQSLAQANQRSS